MHHSYVYKHDISALKLVCSDLICQNRPRRSLCTCAQCLNVSRRMQTLQNVTLLGPRNFLQHAYMYQYAVARVLVRVSFCMQIIYGRVSQFDADACTVDQTAGVPLCSMMQAPFGAISLLATYYANLVENSCQEKITVIPKVTPRSMHNRVKK